MNLRCGIASFMGFEDLSSKLRGSLLRTPATELIVRTVFEQWRLVGAGLITALVGALSEGVTLAIIFLAVDVLTGARTSVALPGIASSSWIFPASGSALVVWLMAFAVLAQAVQSLMRYGNKVCVGYLAARCRARVSSLIHDQVLSFSFSCASGYKVGELTNFANAAPAAVQIQIEVISDLIVGVLMSLVYVAVLIRISPWLLVAAIVLALIIVFIQKFLEPRIRQGSQRMAGVDQAVSSRAVEDYQALRMLHSSGRLTFSQEQFRGLMAEMEAAFRAQSRRLALIEPLASLLPIIAVAAIVSLSLVLIGSQSQAARVLPGLVTFVLALQRLNVRLAGISNSFNGLADNSGRLSLTNQILETSDKQFRRHAGSPVKGPLELIEFLDVSLFYGISSIAAVSNLSFSLPCGQTLALVGSSGAGKSSIADLLAGLYEPTSGQICINGQSILELDLEGWQQSLGVVSQDTFLFNASIADNLAFGLKKIDPARIRLAAQQAQAAGFIEALPDGYQTLVGERGYRLSGGQRQRLSLARALLRQPELLILDEATSALDTESERLVQEAIQQVEGKCTVLVIAHRLSTIVNADQILVMDTGRITERGTHQQLLNKDGLYRRLWLQQSQAAAV